MKLAIQLNIEAVRVLAAHEHARVKALDARLRVSDSPLIQRERARALNELEAAVRHHARWCYREVAYA